MKIMNEVGRQSLFDIATRQAQRTYRAASVVGTLDRVHSDVVSRVFQLAADELFNRAAIELRRARRMLALTAAALVGDLVVTFAMHRGASPLAGLLHGGGIVGALVTMERYAIRAGLRRSAYLLGRPARARAEGCTDVITRT